MFSKTKVRKAGVAAVRPESLQDLAESIDILNNWRASHAVPLTSIAQNVRNVAKKVNPQSTVAQRIKRMPSVISKLERYPTMGAERIQDYGGVRAVMSDIDEVVDVTVLLRLSRQRHKLVRFVNYIDTPDDDGYRGVHMIFSFASKSFPLHEGLHIEAQVRTEIQHAWATAVETMGLVARQPLKSDGGDPELLEFFRELSSEFAYLEDSALVPDTIVDRTARLNRIRILERKHAIGNRLLAYSVAVKERNTALRDSKFALLQIDDTTLTITRFNNLEGAEAVYAQMERDNVVDVVLVSADDMTSLERAYPNYFADTSYFRLLLNGVLEAEGGGDSPAEPS